MAKTALQTQVVLRFAGPHEGNCEVFRHGIRVNMPGAVITIGDIGAARAVEGVWRRAIRMLPVIFPTDDRASAFQKPRGTTIWVSVALTGLMSGRDVQGKIPRISPSGRGELQARFGPLVIIMDDRAAAESQIDIWAEAVDLAEAFLA